MIVVELVFSPYLVDSQRVRSFGSFRLILIRSSAGKGRSNGRHFAGSCRHERLRCILERRLSCGSTHCLGLEALVKEPKKPRLCAV